MNRSIFEEIANSIGLPSPTDEQIQQIIRLHEARNSEISDDEIFELYLEFKKDIDGIIDSINDIDYEKEFYEEYFHTYPMLYFSIIPRKVIKERFDKNPVISNNVFSSIPSPISIQDDKYSYLYKDMETYYKIYKSLDNDTDTRQFILTPLDFIKNVTTINTTGIIKTLNELYTQYKN